MGAQGCGRGTGMEKTDCRTLERKMAEEEGMGTHLGDRVGE